MRDGEKILQILPMTNIIMYGTALPGKLLVSNRLPTPISFPFDKIRVRMTDKKIFL